MGVGRRERSLWSRRGLAVGRVEIAKSCPGPSGSSFGGDSPGPNFENNWWCLPIVEHWHITKLNQSAGSFGKPAPQYSAALSSHISIFTAFLMHHKFTFTFACLPALLPRHSSLPCLPAHTPHKLQLPRQMMMTVILLRLVGREEDASLEFSQSISFRHIFEALSAPVHA